MTKTLKNAFLSAFGKLCLICFFLGCSKDVVVNVITSEVKDITNTTATCGGTIQIDGNDTVLDQGVCWDSKNIPTISNSKTTDGAGTGSFVSNITGLNPNTTYNVRAYATTNSGTTYGESLSFTTKAGDTVTDIDGNAYNTVTIGTQVWFVENLKVKRFNDGTEIPLVTSNEEWDRLQTSGYCWFDNNESLYKTKQGALYNWYSTKTDKLCPGGWHVPSNDDWVLLLDYLGYPAAGKLKEMGTAHWANPNKDATNSSGFTALPAGSRGAMFESNNGHFGYWWSSSESSIDTESAWIILIYNDYGVTQLSPAYKKGGLACRCVKD